MCERKKKAATEGTARNIMQAETYSDFNTQVTLLATYFLLVTYMPYTLTLKMEAVCSSKMSVNFYQITWHHISLNSG
jgi:hypothetical protein